MNIMISRPVGEDPAVSLVDCKTLEECRLWVESEDNNETVEAFINDDGVLAEGLGLLISVNGEQHDSLKQQFEEMLARVYLAGTANGRNEILREQEAASREISARYDTGYDPGQSKGQGRHG